jgi:hypothetical protein
MSTVLPLACYPYPLPLNVKEAVKVAKDWLCERDGLDFKVHLAPAVPGGSARVLSFVGPTPFAADVAKLRNWEDPVELRGWVEWALDREMPAGLGFTKADWIERHIPGAKYIETIEEVDDGRSPLTFR